MKKEEDYDDVIPQEWVDAPPYAVISPKKPAPKFLCDEKKKVIRSSENVLLALNYLYPNQFRFNAWKEIRETIVNTKEWRPLEDNDSMLARSEIAHAFDDRALTNLSLNNTREAIHQECYKNKINPALDYFIDLYDKWDTVPRLDTWLSKVYGVPETSYYKAVGSNWIKGMVKRVFIPGSKFDYVLVLEGPQGIGKSTSLSVLGGEWHTELTMTPDNKDFFMALQGNLIVEFSEGETLSRSEVKQLKAVISATKDTFRPPYGHEMITCQRKCVFAMTTNQDAYLKDETGNRRWLPVACEGDINLEWLRENRTQLFAEAVQRVMVGNETTYEFPKEETRAMQESRLVEDADKEKVVDWYFIKISEAQRKEGVSTDMAFLGIQPELGYMRFSKSTRADQMRIAGIFKYILFLEKRNVYVPGSTANRYFPTEKTLQIAPKPDEFAVLTGLF